MLSSKKVQKEDSNQLISEELHLSASVRREQQEFLNDSRVSSKCFDGKKIKDYDEDTKLDDMVHDHRSVLSGKETYRFSSNGYSINMVDKNVIRMPKNQWSSQHQKNVKGFRNLYDEQYDLPGKRPLHTISQEFLNQESEICKDNIFVELKNRIANLEQENKVLKQHIKEQDDIITRMKSEIRCKQSYSSDDQDQDKTLSAVISSIFGLDSKNWTWDDAMKVVKNGF